MSPTKSAIQSLAKSFVAILARQLTDTPSSYWLFDAAEKSFLNKFVVSRITSVWSLNDWQVRSAHNQ
jgi:hypothetical protein